MKTSPRHFPILINYLAKTLKNACCLWDSLFINSDKVPTKYIFKTIADLWNIFIQQLI